MLFSKAAASVARLGCTAASRPSKRPLLLTISSRSVQASTPLGESVQPARAGDDGGDVAQKLETILTTSTESPNSTNHASKRKARGPHDGMFANKQDRHFDKGIAGGRGQGGRGGGRGGRVRGRGRGSGDRVAVSHNRYEEEGDGQSRRRERGAERRGGRGRGDRAADSYLRGGTGAGVRDEISKKPLKFQEENMASKEYVDTMTILGRNGQWFKANRAYKEASENPDVEITVYMFNATIAALAKSGRWSEAYTVLDDMRVAGHSMDSYTYNAMIQACVNGGQGPRALKLFDEMSEAAISPDAFTFNHLIKGCKDGDWQMAIDLVKQMENLGLVASSVTYNGLIIACGSAGEVDKALSFLQVMRDRQIMLTEGSFSAAILACGRAGRWERAVSLLDEMEEDDLLPNCYCYNAAMQACLASERWPEAVDILRRSLADPDNADRINFKPTLMACARAGEVRLAQQLIQEIHEAGHLIPQNTINYVEYAERTIKRHGKPGDSSSGSTSTSTGEEVAEWHENEEASAPHDDEQKQSQDGDAGGESAADTRGAEQTLANTTKDEGDGPRLDGDAISDEAVAWPLSEKTTGKVERIATKEKQDYERPPNGESEVVLDSAEGKEQVQSSGTKIKSKRAVNAAEGSTSHTDSGSSPAVSAKPTPVWEPPYSSRKFVLCIKELTARGDGRAAVKLLRSAIEDPAIKVTMTMYEAGLMSAAQHGLLPEAMNILGWIRESGLQPSSMCMVWAIRACGKAEPANVPVALALLKHMDPPDAWGYSAALSACANGYKWQKSLELLEEMSAVGLRANVHCYSAAMAALAKADPPQIDQVQKLLDDMQRAGIEPNNVTYDIAIRAYLDAGETPRAKNLYEAMKKAGAQPLNDLRRRFEASKKKPTVD